MNIFELTANFRTTQRLNPNPDYGLRTATYSILPPVNVSSRNDKGNDKGNNSPFTPINIENNKTIRYKDALSLSASAPEKNNFDVENFGSAPPGGLPQSSLKNDGDSGNEEVITLACVKKELQKADAQSCIENWEEEASPCAALPSTGQGR